MVRRVVLRRVVLRRVLVLRAEVERDGVLRAPVALLLRVAPAAPVLRVVLALRGLALADLRVPLFAALRAVPVLRVPVLRAVVLRAPPVLRAVDRFAVPLLAARRAPPLAAPELEPPSSSDHLPDITRCAASATASAISAPNLLALDMTVVAACEAVSAASIPASRILRRAAGLALIAAAAAASPAPSISRLIAALAILSTVDLLDREDVEPFFLLAFAIAKSSRCSEGKTLQPRNGSSFAQTRHAAVRALASFADK